MLDSDRPVTPTVTGSDLGPPASGDIFHTPAAQLPYRGTPAWQPGAYGDAQPYDVFYVPPSYAPSYDLSSYDSPSYDPPSYELPPSYDPDPQQGAADGQQPGGWTGQHPAPPAAHAATATLTRRPAVAGQQDSEATLLRALREQRRRISNDTWTNDTWTAPPVPRREPLPAPPAPPEAVSAVSDTAQVAAAEDQKLLEALGRALSGVQTGTFFPRLAFAALGFTAISSLALAYIEAVPLPISASFVLVPAVVTMILLGARHPEWGRRALIGWGAGIVATILYDVARLAAVQLGVFGDPIPGIGDLLLNREGVPWFVGYGWRFMGNGGGMAIAFTMLPWRGVRAGTIYGTMICLGLFAVLAFFPVAQTHFFPLEPLTAAVGLLGHWIYGAVLGGITKHYLPPSTARVTGMAGSWVPGRLAAA